MSLGLLLYSWFANDLQHESDISILYIRPTAVCK